MFDRLEREGFYFGVDTYLRAHTLLQAEGPALRRNPEKLKYLLAPLLAHSQDGQAKFYRVFDDYMEEVRERAAMLLSEGEQVTDTQEEQLKVIRKNTYPVWAVPSVVALFALLSFGVLFFGGESAHPIPEAYFHVLNSKGDTLSLQEEEVETDTLSLSGFIKDTISFHFDPGQDKEGINDVELLWLYGDGEGDTLSYEDDFFEPRHRVYPLEGAYLVRLMVRHSHEGLETDLEDEVDFFHVQLNLECPDPLFPSIQYNPTEILAGDEVNFDVSFNVNIAEEDFYYNWQFGKEGSSNVANPSYRFDERGEYAIDLELIRKEPLGIRCQDTALARIVIEVGSDQPSIELANEFLLISDDTGAVLHRLSRWSIALISILITALVLALCLLIRRLMYKSTSPEMEEEFQAGKEGPFSVQLPRQDHLIAADKGIYDLASVMRQRRMGNIEQLNLPVSIDATIRESGLPILHFDTHSSATEYLLLIEQHHPQSHLARFFGRITEILQGEDVLLESFYYDKDPRICWNDAHPEGITIENLQQRYNKHRLILFTTGHQLIDVYEPKLLPWFTPLFKTWKENRLILTPIPVVDWGYKEKLLMEELDVLPLDIPGQMHMIEMFEEIGQPDFLEHKKRLLTQFPAAAHSVKKYDIETVEGLRQYLGPHLFNWLAATVVYPVPNWEVTLAMGHALSHMGGAKNQDYLLTFENLLTLARIPWMQSCDLSQELRMDLLRSLDVQTERKAREVVLDLLGKVKTRPNSHIQHKLAIQEVTNQFFLTPGDEQIARKMHYLMEQNKLGDAVTQKRLHQEADIMDGQKGSDYLHNLFGFLRPREFILAGGIGFATICLVSFLLYEFVGKEPKSMSWFSNQEVNESIWVHHHLEQDSAMVWHNQAVDLSSVGEFIPAEELLDLAIEYRQTAYPLADTNKAKIIYLRGQQLFNESDYGGALADFKRMPLSTDPELLQHTWAGIALCYYHLDSLNAFQAMANQLLDTYPDFMKENYPNLYAALDITHDYQYHIDLAKGFFESEEYTSSLSHADSALIIRDGDSLATYWFNRADSALVAQQFIANKPFESESDRDDRTKQNSPFEGHTSEIIAMAYDPQRRQILTGSRDYTARLWSSSGDLIQTFEGHKWVVTSVAMRGNGNLAVTGSFDNSVMVWSTDGGKLLNRISIGKERVHSIALSSDGRYIAIGKDYGASMYDLKGDEIRKFDTYGGATLAIDFSPDGRYILTGEEDGSVKLWSTQNGSTQQSFKISDHPDKVESVKWLKKLKLPYEEASGATAVTFSPDGKYIIAGGRSPAISIWETQTGRPVYNFRGSYRNKVVSLNVSADGRYLSVAREAEGVEVWDINSGNTVFSYSNSSLSAAVMTPDASQAFVATGTTIQNILIGKLQSQGTPPQSQVKEEPIIDETQPQAVRCSDADLENWIGEISATLSAQELKYDARNNTDASGIFYRVLDSLGKRCNNLLIPNISSNRSSTLISLWYKNKGKYTEIDNPLSRSSYIRPGAIMFYGRLTSTTNENKKLKTAPRINRTINHVGIVVSVNRDKSGEIISYTLFHARSANQPASITTHKRDTGNDYYPAFGNGLDRWLGVASMLE